MRMRIKSQPAPRMCIISINTRNRVQRTNQIARLQTRCFVMFGVVTSSLAPLASYVGPRRDTLAFATFWKQKDAP